MTRLREFPPWAVLTGLVAVSTALRIWGGTLVPAPWYTPDEMIYGMLGQSLWSTGRLQILGASTPFYSLVYPAFVGLPLSLHDTKLGFEIVQWGQALVMSLTAVPVYLWSRTMMRRGWALVAAALTLAVPGLAFSGFVMSETVFYPVLVLAAWAMAATLSRPTPLRQAVLAGACVLAILTRLQAIVLVPAFLLAVLLVVVFERRPAALRRFVPALAGLGLAAIGIVAVKGPGFLGAYRTVGEQSYGGGDAVSFSAYHVAAVLLAVGVVPVVATALTALPAFAGREASADVRAFVAVAVSLFAGLVAQVGLFTSAYTGRLADRNLLSLFPILLIGFALWLDRGAPRPRVATAVVSALALLAVGLLPPGRFIVEAAIPDSYGLVPFYRLHVGAPSLELGLVLFAGTLVALLALAFVPRRALAILPLAVAAYLAVASVVVTRTVAHQARNFWPFMVGDDLRWVDERADGPTAFLYAADPLWNRAWYNALFNRRIDRIYSLGTERVLGPMPQRVVELSGSGRLDAPATPYVVAPWYFTLDGRRVAGQPVAELALWKVRSPLRVSTWTLGVTPAGALANEAQMRVFGCQGGRLALTLNAAGPRQVTIRRNGFQWSTFPLQGGQTWNGSVPGKPDGGICLFEVSVQDGVYASRFEYVRNVRR
ncbi:MAG: glycosyltransferase family 39 protein [Actinomycetota bacterium]|nr:glycosyltransferase family 39 protein [Actinomycetota bacterium]